MSREPVDPGGDFDPHTALITMDLTVLGDVAHAVAAAWSLHRGVEPPTMMNEDGSVAEDGAVIARAAWGHIMHQYRQNEFARQVAADLERLITLETPQHRPEFE